MSSQRLPRQIITKNYATEFTTTFENVVVDRKNKTDRVYHNKYQKKYFQNKDQLDYVIEYLVLDKGYFMDSERAGKIVFTNPKEPRVYTFDLNELSCNLEEKVLVGKLS